MKGGLACEAALNESPASIPEAFPYPGAKRNRPKSLRPAVKRRMTSPRLHSARWNYHSAAIN